MNAEEDSVDAVLKMHFSVERLVNELLTGLLSKKKYLKYSLRNMDHFEKINVLGLLGLDPLILEPLRKFGNLRNKFSHYSPNRTTILDGNLLKPLVDSFEPHDIKNLDNWCKSPFPRTLIPNRTDEQILKLKSTIKLMGIQSLIIFKLQEEKKRLFES